MRWAKPSANGNSSLIASSSGDSAFREANLTDQDAVREAIDVKRPIVVIVPGYSSIFSSEGGVFRELAQVWSDAEGVNVIVVNWSAWAYCSYVDIITEYSQLVAEYLADKINFLQTEMKIPRENFTFAGHSVGGQIIGLTSRMLPRPNPICYGEKTRGLWSEL